MVSGTDPEVLTTGVNLGQGFSASLFGSNGAPTGGQTVDHSTAGNAAVNLGGDYYAVTYMSQIGNADQNSDLYTRIYRFSDGAQVGSEVKLNSNTQFYQFGPEMAKLKEGGFITVWTSNHTSTSGTHGTMDDFNVYARRMDFDSSTGALTFLDAADKEVNTTTSGVNGTAWDYANPQLSVAALEHGGYVVAWAKFTAANRADIYSQTYDAAGNKMGGETLVSTGAAGSLDAYPTVTALEDGGYIVAWSKQTDTTTNFYTNQTGDIYAQIVNIDGSLRSATDTGHLPIAQYLTGPGALTGGAGVDTLDGRHGATSFAGGGDDDFIIINNTGFTSLEGGAGHDTLIWDSTGHLDFSTIAGKVSNIEAIHLGDANPNTLTLSLSDVLGASTTSDSLVILGGPGDQVDINMSDWSLAGTAALRGESYNVYINNTNNDAVLWIQNTIHVI